MEGKALLFKWLGGVDAVPIMLDTKDPDEMSTLSTCFPSEEKDHVRPHHHRRRAGTRG